MRQAAGVFEGFEPLEVRTAGAVIRGVRGGTGPPLLLIHGYPQTHAMWHRVAPRLAGSYAVVACDSRGYGASSKPPGGPDHAAYAKRALARDLIEVMDALGHDTFAVAGHDRGGRVAYRMALDHPDRVSRLIVLDMIPTLDTWEQMSFAGSLFAYHWYFLAQPSPLPETLIASNAAYFLRHTIDSWCGTPGGIEPDAMRAYIEAFTPDTIRASCDDYRAGAGIDRDLDLRDREASRRIGCPVLALWGDRSRQRPPLTDAWRRWADQVEGRALDCGHFVAEEAPDALVEEMLRFLGKSS